MEQIQTKKGQPKKELNGDLMMKAYNDAVDGIEQGAYKSDIGMGIVEINGETYLLTVTVERFHTLNKEL